MIFNNASWLVCATTLTCLINGHARLFTSQKNPVRLLDQLISNKWKHRDINQKYSYSVLGRVFEHLGYHWKGLIFGYIISIHLIIICPFIFHLKNFHPTWYIWIHSNTARVLNFVKLLQPCSFIGPCLLMYRSRALKSRSGLRAALGIFSLL